MSSEDSDQSDLNLHWAQISESTFSDVAVIVLHKITVNVHVAAF